MGYLADSFTAGETPTTSKWNKLWDNDEWFNDQLTRLNGYGYNLVVTGGLGTKPGSGRVMTVPAATIHFDDAEYAIAAIASRTFTASKDTYVTADDAGYHFYEVAVGAARPTPTSADELWVMRVTTDASNITVVYDMRILLGRKAITRSGATQTAVTTAFPSRQTVYTLEFDGVHPGAFVALMKTAVAPITGATARGAVELWKADADNIISAGLHNDDADYTTGRWVHRTVAAAWDSGADNGYLQMKIKSYVEAGGTRIDVGHAGDPRWATAVTLLSGVY